MLENKATKEEKMNTVFDYVKSRMNWSKKNSYYCDKGVKKAYAEKVGNTAEINLMLVAMLRHAGLNANPVLVSTRSNGIALYPNRFAYNYVIAAVETDKGIVLLDATSKYTQPDMLPLRALNWTGRMIMENGSNKEVNLMPVKNAREIINIAASIDKSGSVAGKVREQYYDNYALNFRERHAGANSENYTERLEKFYKGIEISNYKVTYEDLQKPVVEEFDFVHNGLSDIIGGMIYINPMLFFTKTENPFKQETREYPIDFNYPQQDKYMISINLPDGYTIESLPDPGVITMEQNIGSFKYNITSNGGQIQVSAVFEINYANVSQDYYKVIRDFYQKMTDKQGEKIVLKKV